MGACVGRGTGFGIGGTGCTGSGLGPGSGAIVIGLSGFGGSGPDAAVWWCVIYEKRAAGASVPGA